MSKTAAKESRFSDPHLDWVEQNYPLQFAPVVIELMQMSPNLRERLLRCVLAYGAAQQRVGATFLMLRSRA